MSETYDGHGGYRFGEFTLDVDRGELFRGEDRVKIRPKSFDVLEYLVEHRGKLVGRDELLDKLWAGTVVTEDAVTQCLIDIRKAIGDDDQAMIRTVPRRGYIFEEPVEALGEPDGLIGTQAPASPALRLMGVVALVAAGLTAVAAVLWMSTGSPDGESDEQPVVAETAASPSIAVLPFEVMSADQAPTYFADGVSEEIRNSLARQRGLRVIARTSSFSFRGQNADVRTIASRLDVSHVLEGSVRKDGDALRVSVQLVDAMNGEYVWTRQFDRELSATSVFAIQSEIASAVVDSLRVELTPQDREQLALVPTENLTALEAYFEARELMATRRPPELEKAVALLEGAVERDPEFALAYVALADALRLWAGYGTLPYDEADERGMRAVRAALAINDSLGEAHASLGNLLSESGDIDEAEEAYLKGIELSPSYAPLYQWYGEFLAFSAGRPEEAVIYGRIAVALDPHSAIIANDYAEMLLEAGRPYDAIAQIEAALEIDPEFGVAYSLIGAALHQRLGRVAEAIQYLEKGVTYSPGDPSSAVYLAYAYADLGDFETAARLIDEALSVSPEGAHAHFARFSLSVVLGDNAAARESAEIVNELWDGLPETLRFLRDRDIAAEDAAQAIERYGRYFPELTEEGDIELVGWNFMSAIDLAYVLGLVGRRERAEQLLASSLEYIGDRSPTGPLYIRMAEVRIYAILGDTERALTLLRELVDDGWRARWRFELEHDLAFAELRKTPEFADIVATIRADMEQQRASLSVE